MNILLKYLLFPFSLLYGAGVVFRNILFDWGIFKSRSFPIPIIGIGNLSAGGTGKTPMAEYLLKFLLARGYKPAMLSRGYGRQSEGFLEVKTELNAMVVGDEPYQVKRKLPEVYVAVCEDRAKGIEAIMADDPAINVIVLDDSFQHRKVRPGFNVLLTDYSRPYYKDLLLPSGMLREPISGRKRADTIIVTKCPQDINNVDKEMIKTKLKPLPSQEVYFTSIANQSLVSTKSGSGIEDSIPTEELAKYKTVLFTGIANTATLETFLNYNGVAFEWVKFRDHHRFSDSDIEMVLRKWRNMAGEHKLMMTTEKDWRRTEGTEQERLFLGLPLYFLPIGVQWDTKEERDFENRILKYVEGNRRSS